MTLFMFVFIENARWSSQLKSKQIAFNIHLFNFLLLIWSYHATLVLALYFLSYYVHIGPLFLIILCSYWPFISYHTMLVLALYFLSYYAHIGPLFLIILCSYWPFISYHTMLILALYFLSYYARIGPLFLILCSYWPFISTVCETKFYQ
jgi:hypothetical protein